MENQTSQNNDELNLPWKIYFFNKNGYYDKKDVITIQKKETMQNSYIVGLMRIQNKNKLEIRVCDCLDYCIMHWKNGERIFPK